MTMMRSVPNGAPSPGLDGAVDRLSSEECIVTLAKVLDNIITESTYNKKTRKLKLSNQTFARRVARHEGGVDFLLACKFSQRGQLLELKKEKESKALLWEARKALSEHASFLSLSVPPLPEKPKGEPETPETTATIETDVQRKEKTGPAEESSVYSACSQPLSIDDELELEIMRELEDDGIPVPTYAEPRSQDQSIAITLAGGEAQELSEGQETSDKTQEQSEEPETPNDAVVGGREHQRGGETESRAELSEKEQVPVSEPSTTAAGSQEVPTPEITFQRTAKDSFVAELEGVLNQPVPAATAETNEIPTLLPEITFQKTMNDSFVAELEGVLNQPEADQFNNKEENMPTSSRNHTTPKEPVDLDLPQETAALEVVKAHTPVIIKDVAPSQEEERDLGRNAIGSRDNSIKDFFNEALGFISASPGQDHERVPQRKRVSPQSSTDDLENEMASLLEVGVEMPKVPRLDVQWQDEEEHQTEKKAGGNDDDKTVPVNHESNDLPEDESASKTSDGPPAIPDNETVMEDMNYTSIHAHTDWYRLHQLMVQHSLQREYEVCWGSLCTLSVVTADLSMEEFGIKTSRKANSGSKSRRSKSKRSWLPLELIQGLWKLVLSEEKTLDGTRIDFVCTKLHDVLLESKFLEVFDREEEGAELPHSSWVRVRKEKMVLLGYGLKLSIDCQGSWMRKLANAIVEDVDFWYGRFALPTIARAGDDSQTLAKELLKNPDFVQSRLDVLGIVSGTERHVRDCKEYVNWRQEAFKTKKYRSVEVKVGLAEEIGHDVALDGCQQVATCLYKFGQLLARTRRSSSQQSLELAKALHVVGLACGEWGDYQFESQLYEKVRKVLRDSGESMSVCAADTLLSMGANHLVQGDFSAAMRCYEEAMEMYKKKLGAKDDHVAKALHHIGVIHCERSELDTAMESFKISLKIRQGNGTANDYDESMAETLCWIGKVYREQGLPGKAKKYFDTARELKEDFFGADSLEVAEILHNIAIIYDDEGSFERSLQYYRKSLQIRRASLGDVHEDVSELITCIGNVYKSMGDDETALKVFRKSLDLRSSLSKTITLNRDQTKSLISAHEDVLSLLKARMKSGLTGSDKEEATSEVASMLLKMGHLYDTMEHYDRSMRCFEKALKIRLNSGSNMGAGLVLNVIGISLAKRRKYSEAMSNFQQALALRKGALGEAHVEVAETLHNMGNCAAKSNIWNEARTYYDEALRIKRKTLGSKSLSVAQTLHNIGNVLASQGSNDLAMNNYEEALSTRRSILGNDHVEVAFSLHCIAKINWKKHQVEAARDNFTQALRIKRAKLGPNHLSVAETLEQLGSFYMEIGEDEEASTCLNSALTIYKTKHGESIKVAEVYEVLGTRYESKGDHTKTLHYFSRALRVRTKVLGQEDVTVAELHYKIGRIQKETGMGNEALSSFQSATRIRKKTIGRNDLMIADILCEAGLLQLKFKQVEVADKCFSEALRIRQHILDGHHEKIGECMMLNGDILQVKQEYDQAIDMFTEALGIFEMTCGPKSLLAAESCYRLGVAYKSSNRLDKAQDFLEKCLATRVSVLGHESLEVSRVNRDLGSVHFTSGNYSRAEELFRDSVETMVKKLGEDHMEVADTVLLLGQTCTKLNSPDEALMYFEQARLTKQQHCGDSSLEVAEIGLEIGRAHVAKREFEESLECFQSYLRARRAAVGDDEVVSDVLYEIGNAEYEIRHLDAALTNLASALALYRVLLGDEHLSVANTLYSLGLVYESKQQYKESLKYHKESFRLRRRLCGADDLGVAQSLESISSLYLKQPNHDKALQSMKEALRIRTGRLGKHHPTVATTLYGMGVVLSETTDQQAKAMECYRVALAIRQDQLGQASVEAAQTLHNMGTLLAKQQDYEAALEHWRQALVAYRESGHSDEDHLVAITIGNIHMAENFLDEQHQQDDQA